MVNEHPFPWTDDPEIGRRVGRFIVQRRIVQEFGLSVLHLIQQCCTFKSIDQRWDMDADIYYALNPQFGVVSEGEIVPWYDLLVEQDDDGIVGFRWELSEDQEKSPRA